MATERKADLEKTKTTWQMWGMWTKKALGLTTCKMSLGYTGRKRMSSLKKPSEVIKS